MRRHSIVWPRTRTLGVILGLAALVSIAWILAAGSPTTRSGSGSSAAPAPGTAAMRIGVQPETGALVPAPLDAPLDDLGLPKPAGDLVVRTRPDGAQYVDIRGHFMSYSVAHVAGDGRIEETCVSDPNTARSLVQGAVPVPSTTDGEEK